MSCVWQRLFVCFSILSSATGCTALTGPCCNSPAIGMSMPFSDCVDDGNGMGACGTPSCGCGGGGGFLSRLKGCHHKSNPCGCQQSYGCNPCGSMGTCGDCFSGCESGNCGMNYGDVADGGMMMDSGMMGGGCPHCQGQQNQQPMYPYPQTYHQQMPGSMGPTPAPPVNNQLQPTPSPAPAPGAPMGYMQPTYGQPQQYYQHQGMMQQNMMMQQQMMPQQMVQQSAMMQPEMTQQMMGQSVATAQYPAPTEWAQQPVMQMGGNQPQMMPTQQMMPAQQYMQQPQPLYVPAVTPEF